MQQLSDTLPAMKSPEDLAKVQSLGSTAKGGITIIEPRPSPLTESDLTAIASKLLLKSPTVCWTKRKKYDEKSFSNEVIGEEDAVEVSILWRGPMSQQLLEAALRPSPPAAITEHLVRLAKHKRLGDSDKTRAILLHDYAEALRHYSDFVVYIACKTLWEDSDREFYPKIKTLREVCETFHAAFTSLLGKVVSQGTLAAAPKVKLGKEEDSPGGKQRRREMCDYLVSIGKPDYYDQVRFWSNYDLEKAVAREKAALAAIAEAGTIQKEEVATSTAQKEKNAS